MKNKQKSHAYGQHNYKNGQSYKLGVESERQAIKTEFLGGHDTVNASAAYLQAAGFSKNKKMTFVFFLCFLVVLL